MFLQHPDAVTSTKCQSVILSTNASLTRAIPELCIGKLKIMHDKLTISIYSMTCNQVQGQPDPNVHIFLYINLIVQVLLGKYACPDQAHGSGFVMVYLSCYYHVFSCGGLM